MKAKFNSWVAKLAMKTAISAAGAASFWNTYQPKEPAKLKDIAAK